MPYDNPDFFTLWQCFVLVTLAPQSLRVNSFRLFDAGTASEAA